VTDTVGADGEEANGLALERTALTNCVTWGENNLYGVGRGSEGRGVGARGYVWATWRDERMTESILGELERILQHV